MKKMILICLVVAVQQLQAQVLTTLPSNPQSKKEVTITYCPSSEHADLIDQAAGVELIFTSSTFYNLPWEMEMIKKGTCYEVSFLVPPYATFASFYFKSGKMIDNPATGGDYTLAVYDGKKRVKDSYFHESYSIKTQFPKAPDLQEHQIQLLKKELAAYPDNFEAKVRLKSIEMAAAKSPAAALEFRTKARSIIQGQFAREPLSASNMSRVTMGFNMIGESYRTDSLRKIVMKRYPQSDLGKVIRTSFLAKEVDSVNMIAQLVALLGTENQDSNESSVAIYKILFKYALRKGEEAKAITYARKSLGAVTPYTPRDLRDIATAFTSYKLAPDTAFAYAAQSLAQLDQWPVGNIRNLPKFGYVLPYVPDSTRKVAITEAKAGLLSVMALNKLYVGEKTAALDFTKRSLKEVENRDNLMNAGVVYDACDEPVKAYDALWKVIMANPFDEAAIALAKRNFGKSNTKGMEFDQQLEQLQQARNTSLSSSLNKQLMNRPQPELDGLTDLAGNIVKLSSLKDKIVVMDFWATWCVPCMKEMPFLQKVYDKYKSNPNVVFMVINTGAGNVIDDARGWVKKNKSYTFPIYFNNDKDIEKKIGYTVIPTVALLDKSGNMQFRTVGFEGPGMEAKLTQQIEILLKL
jgi:thiol-disulfide isomerase/thioredoxin